MDSIEAVFALHLLGTFFCRVGGRELPRLRTRKGYILLALLALRAGRPIDRDFLTGVLWPDSDDKAGSMSLRRALTDLRHALGEEAQRVVSEGHQTVHLSLADGAFVDVVAFDALYTRWQKTGNTADAQQALALYHGSLLEGYTETYFSEERATREEQHVILLESLAQGALMRGDAGNAVVLCRRAERQDPLRESTQRILYEALASQGELTAARCAFRDFRVLLHRETGQNPDAATAALFERLKAGPSLSPTPAPSPLHLPIPLTPIIGREDEITSVVRFLDTARLVSLTGSGGVGKTRLSFAVGETIADEFTDGVWFVDLAPVTEQDLLAAVVLRTLNIIDTSTSQSGGEEFLLAHLRDKKLLLILDNCEQVVTAVAALVAPLLSRCPYLRILTTTRQALGITGEIVHRVPSLSPSDSMILFTARALAVRGILDNDSQRLCELLEGVPLALELAAAWTRALSCGEIVTRFRRSLDFLVSSDPAAPARQRTLRAAHEASFALLSADERRLLCRLSFFEGGWTYDAAEEVCDADLVSMTGLADKSLLTRNGERWTMLETTRQFARAQWSDRDKPEIIRRHAGYYRRLMEAIEDVLQRQPEPATPWIEKAKIEEGNCRRAWVWAREQGEAAGIDWEVMLLSIGIMNSHGAEATSWLERVKRASHETFALSSLGARHLLTAGYLSGWRGDHAEMRRLSNIGLERARACDEPFMESVIYHHLGMDAVREGDFASAHRYYAAERDLLLTLDREDAQRQLDLDFGDLLDLEGDADGATRLFARCLEAGRRRGASTPLIARALSHLAHQAGNRKDYATARRFLEELVEYRRRFDLFGLNRCLLMLGRVAGKQCDWAAADAYLSESLTLSHESYDTPRIGWARLAKASIALVRCAFADAHSELSQAIVPFTSLKERGSLVVCLRQIARIYAAEGKTGEAVRLWACTEHPAQYASWPLYGKERDRLDAEIATARTALSAAAFSRAWKEGQETTLEDALAYYSHTKIPLN